MLPCYSSFESKGRVKPPGPGGPPLVCGAFGGRQQSARGQFHVPKSEKDQNKPMLSPSLSVCASLSASSSLSCPVSHFLYHRGPARIQQRPHPLPKDKLAFLNRDTPPATLIQCSSLGSNQFRRYTYLQLLLRALTMAPGLHIRSSTDCPLLPLGTAKRIFRQAMGRKLWFSSLSHCSEVSRCIVPRARLAMALRARVPRRH